MDYESFGSQTALFGSDHSNDKLPSAKGSFKVIKKTVKRSKCNERKELCISFRVCYDTLQLLLLVSVIIIVTIYISHLQQHTQELERRVCRLETLLGIHSGTDSVSNAVWEYKPVMP